MNWKDILKGEEINPTVRSMDAKEQKEIKEEINRLEDLYNTEPLNPEREKMVMDRIKELSAQVGIKPKRMRPQNENDNTLFQLDVMNLFRDYVLKIMSLNFSGRTDMKNEKGEVKMPKTASVILLLKKFDKGHFIDKRVSWERITSMSPAEFVAKERKLAEAIIDQIVDTLKVFPKSEDTKDFVRYAKSKLPRLTTSIATD